MIINFDIEDKISLFMSQLGDFIIIIELDSDLISISVDIGNFVTVIQSIVTTEIWLDDTSFEVVIRKYEFVDELPITD